MSEGVMPRSGSEPQLNAGDENFFGRAGHIAHFAALEISVNEIQHRTDVAVGS